MLVRGGGAGGGGDGIVGDGVGGRWWWGAPPPREREPNKHPTPANREIHTNQVGSKGNGKKWQVAGERNDGETPLSSSYNSGTSGSHPSSPGEALPETRDCFSVTTQFIIPPFSSNHGLRACLAYGILRTCPLMWGQVLYPPTHPLTDLPTHLPAILPIYPCPRTYLNPPTCTYPLIHPSTHPPTHPLNPPHPPKQSLVERPLLSRRRGVASSAASLRS